MLYIIYFNILLKQNLIINNLILIWSNLNIASKLSVNQNQLI